MRRRFFVDKFESNSATLQGDAAEHLGRVLRAEPGQLYELSDGHRVFLARIERVETSKRNGNRVDFSLVEPVAAPQPRLEISLLVSIVKFDRFEWCLEKATELGAAEIIPLAAARTDKPLIAAAHKRRERWQKILLESAQQSRRLRSPVLGETASPENAFRCSHADLKIFLSEQRDVSPFRASLVKEGQISAALAIGPEGGWTDAEIAAARNASFTEVSLGENILRTETALIASLAVLHFALQS